MYRHFVMLLYFRLPQIAGVAKLGHALVVTDNAL
jgi:hypothetical protein